MAAYESKLDWHHITKPAPETKRSRFVKAGYTLPEMRKRTLKTKGKVYKKP